MLLVVGGDHLGSIAGNLKEMGFRHIQHVKGRTEQRVYIGADTELVLILVDYVNHNLVRWVKEHARMRELPVIFARRSWTSIARSLEKCKACRAADCGRSGALGQAVG